MYIVLYIYTCQVPDRAGGRAGPPRRVRAHPRHPRPLAARRRRRRQDTGETIRVAPYPSRALSESPLSESRTVRVGPYLSHTLSESRPVRVTPCPSRALSESFRDDSFPVRVTPYKRRAVLGVTRIGPGSGEARGRRWRAKCPIHSCPSHSCPARPPPVPDCSGRPGPTRSRPLAEQHM